MSAGFFTVGIYHTKTEVNVGTLMRAAWLYGAAEVFTIGRRYQRQASDTPNTAGSIPLHHYESFDSMYDHMPYGAPLVAVEMSDRAVPLGEYRHPDRAVYLLGAEDHGLPPDILARCHQVVQVESLMPVSHNVAVAGSIVLWHRHTTPSRKPVMA